MLIFEGEGVRALAVLWWWEKSEVLPVRRVGGGGGGRFRDFEGDADREVARAEATIALAREETCCSYEDEVVEVGRRL